MQLAHRLWFLRSDKSGRCAPKKMAVWCNPEYGYIWEEKEKEKKGLNQVHVPKVTYCGGNKIVCKHISWEY